LVDDSPRQLKCHADGQERTMRLRLQLLWLILALLWRKRRNVLDEVALSLVVLPNDIDVSKISDDRYLAIVDLGRVDLVLRTGLLRTLIMRKWAPLATSVTMRFRHPLKIFQRYQLLTKIVFWDDDVFYSRQRFQRHGRIVATAYVCATLLGPNGSVHPADILAELDGRGRHGRRRLQGSRIWPGWFMTSKENLATCR
jgi:acyl-CoA thioesterase FadM